MSSRVNLVLSAETGAVPVGRLLASRRESRQKGGEGGASLPRSDGFRGVRNRLPSVLTRVYTLTSVGSTGTSEVLLGAGTVLPTSSGTRTTTVPRDW